MIVTRNIEVVSPVTRRRWCSGVDLARRHSDDALPNEINRSNRAVHAFCVLRAELCLRSITRIFPTGGCDYLGD